MNARSAVSLLHVVKFNLNNQNQNKSAIVVSRTSCNLFNHALLTLAKMSRKFFNNTRRARLDRGRITAGPLYNISKYSV